MDDIWTAAKGMYKTEPAVADGGEVVIYAPQHTQRSSYSHRAVLDEIGYHCRALTSGAMGQVSKVSGEGSWTLHATKGLGTYDRAQPGWETSRVQVTLATSIPEGACRRVNLG